MPQKSFTKSQKKRKLSNVYQQHRSDEIIASDQGQRNFGKRQMHLCLKQYYSKYVCDVQINRLFSSLQCFQILLVTCSQLHAPSSLLLAPCFKLPALRSLPIAPCSQLPVFSSFLLAPSLLSLISALQSKLTFKLHTLGQGYIYQVG